MVEARNLYLAFCFIQIPDQTFEVLNVRFYVKVDHTPICVYCINNI
jgi:hypothetical protein